MLASARAIKAYRNMGFKGMIGLVSDSYPIEILKDNEGYREAKRLADIFFNTSVNDTCIKGYYPDAVSYTHLDVYKRQGQYILIRRYHHRI